MIIVSWLRTLEKGHFFMVCVATPDAFDALCGGGGERKMPAYWIRPFSFRFATKMLSNLPMKCRVLQDNQLNYWIIEERYKNTIDTEASSGIFYKNSQTN